jgi:predicted nucleotidyltransferase
MSKNDLVNSLIPVIQKYKQDILFAYLFGSTARAVGAPSGDIDIAFFLAEGTLESYFETKLSLHADLCRALKRNDVDLVVLNTATNLMLLDEITRTGVVLYDRAPDVRMDFELGVLHRALDFKSHRLAIMGV